MSSPRRIAIALLVVGILAGAAFCTAPACAVPVPLDGRAAAGHCSP